MSLACLVGRPGNRASVSAFSNVGSVTHVAGATPLVIINSRCQTPLEPLSQYQTIPLAIAPALFHRSNLVAGGREGHQSVGHKYGYREALGLCPAPRNADPLPRSHSRGPGHSPY